MSCGAELRQEVGYNHSSSSVWFAPQLSEQFNKSVDKRSIIDAIAIYAIVAILGLFKEFNASSKRCANKRRRENFGFAPRPRDKQLFS